MKQYDKIYELKNNFAIVKLNGKYGFINELGIEICEPKYDIIFSFNNNNLITIIKLNGKYGIINIYGEELCEIKYDQIFFFNTYNYIRVFLNQKCGFINKQGQEIIKPIYDYDVVDDILDQYIKNHNRNLKLTQLL
jgi:uncharacterized protein YlzI (FlbEa/FlbD family)